MKNNEIPAYAGIKNYIKGEFTNPESNQWIDNYNPSNGEVVVID